MTPNGCILEVGLWQDQETAGKKNRLERRSPLLGSCRILPLYPS